MVSQFHILTAAHCVTETNTKVPRKPEQIVAFLGLHNLKKLDDGQIQKHEIKDIRLHPQYTVIPYNNDLAVLKVKNYVDYTEFVWPICLWKPNEKDLSKYIGKDGVKYVRIN